jgi:hypothetical protein
MQHEVVQRFPLNTERTAEARPLVCIVWGERYSARVI